MGVSRAQLIELLMDRWTIGRMRSECAKLKLSPKKVKKDCAHILAHGNPRRVAKMLGVMWNGLEGKEWNRPRSLKTRMEKKSQRSGRIESLTPRHEIPAQETEDEFGDDWLDFDFELVQLDTTKHLRGMQHKAAFDLVVPLVLEFAKDIADAKRCGFWSKRAGDATRGSGVGAAAVGVFQGDLVLGGMFALGGILAGKGISWWNERRNATLRAKWEGLLQGLSPLELGVFSTELRARFPKLWDEADDQFLLE